ncbi:uncharacterized protein L969DRAFT_87452 [Mixia osmundae IAM 14324]|uniref:Uncharacterized protein n=1 Tax=Mixia osmundae (strain CBS 9802 / IAM 14324 / JCM 22182 / KY 12970) TaxID=764103 RepID=G7E0U9_MIXOS|nr:uncharacterized protein L969DRAFT_87452 [Mixia osmundae IAM 14324]KEI39489.1 hypothetical protein L969DRAFT_87452 [Mixia osmundae IAM 14324]GAA96459.1 hypothetical protein E5Q_03126 [Mixia osmundae IAM 14324]
MYSRESQQYTTVSGAVPALPLRLASLPSLASKTRVVTLVGLVGVASLLLANHERVSPENIKHFWTQHTTSDSCNPYAEYGVVHISADTPAQNYYAPINETSCPRSRLLDEAVAASDLAVTTGQSSVSGSTLPWLHDRTVALFGDSHERFHLIDFCRFFGRMGKVELIVPSHPLSPPAYTSSNEPPNENEDLSASRPYVCHVQSFNLTLVNLHMFGVASFQEFKDQDVGSFFRDRHYYPPMVTEDKLNEVFLPLLANIGRPIDLIEFSTGYWDLLHKSRLEDTLDATRRTHAENLPLSYIDWYDSGLRRLLLAVAQAFPDRSVPILFRHLHQVQQRHDTPTNRVAAFGAVGKKVVHDLNTNDTIPHVLKGRLRDDNWGPLLLGQEDHIADTMHYRGYANYIWADIILFELRRAVTGQGA